MDANEYNRIRRILFSTIHNPLKGFYDAFKYLDETYKTKLDARGYTGIKAEMHFYKKFRKEYSLTVAGDMGEHADFAGLHGSSPSRFDVTTNIDYKKLKTYEPFLSEGPAYKIVLVDKSNFEVIDILNLAFERCECGGYKIPFILLKGQNFSDDGEAKWENDQLMMRICNSCSALDAQEEFSHTFLYSPSEFSEGLPDTFSKEQREIAINEYNFDAYKYFRREFRDDIMSVAEHKYIQTDRDGDGYWSAKFHFSNHIVVDCMPPDIEVGMNCDEF